MSIRQNLERMDKYCNQLQELLKELDGTEYNDRALEGQLLINNIRERIEDIEQILNGARKAMQEVIYKIRPETLNR